MLVHIGVVDREIWCPQIYRRSVLVFKVDVWQKASCFPPFTILGNTPSIFPPGPDARYVVLRYLYHGFHAIYLLDVKVLLYLHDIHDISTFFNDLHRNRTLSFTCFPHDMIFFRVPSEFFGEINYFSRGRVGFVKVPGEWPVV